MEASKYDRTIPLTCPTCGATDFAQTEDNKFFTCASCGRKITKDELINENSENIQEHAGEVARQAIPDLERELKKTLQNAFKNSKFIKIK